MSAQFKGEWYKRKRSNDYRNRRTNDVVKTVTLKKRKGKTNQAVYFDGKNWKAVETTGKNFYGFDVPTKKTKSAKRNFEKRVRGKSERRAMFRKMRRA